MRYYIQFERNTSDKQLFNATSCITFIIGVGSGDAGRAVAPQHFCFRAKIISNMEKKFVFKLQFYKTILWLI